MLDRPWIVLHSHPVSRVTSAQRPLEAVTGTFPEMTIRVKTATAITDERAFNSVCSVLDLQLAPRILSDLGDLCAIRRTLSASPGITRT
jgi:hypothetical protein